MAVEDIYRMSVDRQSVNIFDSVKKVFDGVLRTFRNVILRMVLKEFLPLVMF